MTKQGIDEASFKRKLKLAVNEKSDLSRLKSSSLKKIGETVIEQMKDLISAGISPITGKRFEAYKNPAKYPGKQKPPRPVNLFLSGDFLRSLAFRIKTGKIPIITLFFNKSDSDDKEEGHRDGAGGQRKRPIIPKGSEGFTNGILIAVRKVLLGVIDKDLK